MSVEYTIKLSRCLFLICLLVQPALVLAAGGGGHGDGHHGPPWGKLAFMTTNLVIFLAVLRKAAWPMLVEWVANRRSEVVGALEKAAVAKREAEELKQEWANRLASLEQEIEEMRSQAQKQIESERDQILESAKKLAESIRRDAESAAQQELRNAQERLRAEVAERAFKIACDAAPTQLGGSEQKRFVDEFIQQVAK